MSIVGQRSKFSCLKIYDDTSSSSDDDGKKLVVKTLPGKNKLHGNQKTTAAACKKNNGGLIVHSIPQKPKNKGKKNKKTPTVVEDGFIVQDGDEDYLEKMYRQDLQQAIENSSREMACTASVDPTQEISSSNNAIVSRPEQKVTKTVDPVETLISDIDLQASALFTKSDGSQKAREQQLVTLYRSRLLETLRQMMMENEVKLKVEAEATKYKSRYKKLCELLKDAEVNEKAHMAADLEKARTVEKELSSQIGELRGELMQARSKVHELEVKCKELSSKQQH